MKRDSRNIGKRVRIQGHKYFDQEIGLVKGFRGDDGDSPYVNVFIYRTGSIWPIQGRDLQIVPADKAIAEVLSKGYHL